MSKSLNRREFLQLSGGAMAGAWALSLTGCGGGEEGGAREIELFHNQPGFHLEEMGELAAESIGIRINPVDFADPAAFQQGVQSSLRSGETPGMFTWWSGYRLEPLVREQGVQDVSSIWSTQIENGNVLEGLASAYTFEDKQYAVPFTTAYYPVFYNKQIFEENSLQPPQTWDEMITVADTIKDVGVTPFMTSISGRWPSIIYFEELLIRTDPDFYERLVNGEESYTDPVVVEVMEQWKSMFDKGYFNENLDVDLVGSLSNEIAQGNAAMIVNGTWFTTELTASEMTPDEDFGVFVLPNINPDLEENVMIAESAAFAIPTNAPDSEASLEVAEWWMGPEAQSTFTDYLNGVSFNPSVEDAGSETLAELSRTVDENNYRLLDRYWEATPPEIVENAVEELVTFMLNPDQYMEVLEAIENIARDYWDENS